MKKLRRLLSLLILLIGLTACAGEGEGEALATLDRSTWPTPPPVEARSTPTPFPLVEASLLTTPTAEPATATPEAVAQTQPTATSEPAQPPPASEATVAPETTETISATTEAAEAEATTEAASVETVGQVSSFGLNMRQGPGANFEVITELRQGDALTLLERNPSSGWINVQTADGQSGWVNGEFVDFGSLVEPVGNDQPTQASQTTDQQAAVAAPTPAAASSQPPAAASGGGQLIVQLASGGDIMVIHRDGSDLRRLTAGIDPALSPDGRRVAFTRWDSGNDGFLWTINIDGSDETRVIGGARQAKSPTWSPDGSQIALNFQNGGTLDPIEHCQDFSDGQPEFNFWQAYDFRLRYTEIDGEQVPIGVCWKYPADAHWSLRVINLQAQNYEDVPASLYTFGPTWDPLNAWRVVSSGGQGLVWTDVLRGVSERLTSDPSDRGPVFSPDGQYIAVTYWQDNHWEIHRLNADGSGRVRLTQLPLYAVAENIKTWNNASPIFSPDSSEIAFIADRGEGWQVWVMNVDGSNQRPMFSVEVNRRLPIQYDNNDERVLRWGP